MSSWTWLCLLGPSPLTLTSCPTNKSHEHGRVLGKFYLSFWNYSWKKKIPPKLWMEALASRGFVYIRKEREVPCCVWCSPGRFCIRQNLLKLLLLCIKKTIILYIKKWSFYMVQPNNFHSDNSETENLAILAILLKKTSTIREFFVFQTWDSTALCQCQAGCPLVNKNSTCCAEVPNPWSIERESSGSGLWGLLLFRRREMCNIPQKIDL